MYLGDVLQPREVTWILHIRLLLKLIFLHGSTKMDNYSKRHNLSLLVSSDLSELEGSVLKSFKNLSTAQETGRRFLLSNPNL